MPKQYLTRLRRSPTGVKYSFQFSIYHEIKINTNSSPLRLVSVSGWTKSFLLAWFQQLMTA